MVNNHYFVSNTLRIYSCQNGRFDILSCDFFHLNRLPGDSKWKLKIFATPTKMRGDQLWKIFWQSDFYIAFSVLSTPKNDFYCGLQSYSFLPRKKIVWIMIFFYFNPKHSKGVLPGPSLTRSGVINYRNFARLWAFGRTTIVWSYQFWRQLIIINFSDHYQWFVLKIIDGT